MQNFTLGKKGYSMLLFALVLLIGSTSSYGQCPTPAGTDSNQEFCFLATVGDIQTDGTAVFQTADNDNDTQPIPSDEILSDDTTYFVGGVSGTCTRIPVAVNIIFEDYPNNRLVPGENSFTISPCESNFTAEQLATYFDPIPGYEIRVYEEEFGTVQAAGPLTPNDSYFVGQVSSSGTSSPDNCPSLRVAVGYDPQPTPPPTATSPQTFCEGATVGDLEAQGTSPNTQSIRWYRTATSFQPLSDNTILLNGATYYATQVINDRNSELPPCESDTRTAVEVILQPRTNVESTQSFCASLGSGNDFRMPQVRDLSPEGGTFFAEENSTTPLDPNTVLVQGEDYFNRDNGADCSQDRIEVNFFDTPNAGGTTQTTTCTNDDSFNLVSRIGDSQLGAPQDTGFFTPALTSGDNTFIPQDYAAGTYTFTYTVPGNSNCPTDTSVISVEVQQAPNAGPDQTITFCQSEIETLVNLVISDPVAAQAILTQRITNADLNGSFSNTDLENIALGYLQAVNGNDFPFNAAAVYTVDNGNCQDSSNIQVVVNESPYAGDDTNIEVNSTQEPFNLYDVLVENSNMTPNTGGEFSPGNINGDFNPATANSGTYTYTVTNQFGCTDTANINVTVLVDLGCPEVMETPQSFCESISDADGNNPRRPRVRDLSPMEATWYASADSDTPIPGNTILVDGNVYFAGNTNGTCNNRMPVRVNIDPAPNAGATTILNVCSADAPFNISSRMNPSILGAADAGGSIFPALASGTDLFDPSVDNAGRYTYRVASANSGCEDDTAFVTINITDPIIANAGADVSLTFCSTDGIIDLNTRLANDAFPGGSFSGLTNGQFDPSTVSIGVNTITYTVDNSIACVSGTDSATYTINIIQGPNAGQDGSVSFSNTQEGTFNLSDYLQGNPTAGGSWNPGNEDGTFIPEGKANGTYVFTYSVTNTNNCSDTASVTVTITDEIISCPEITETTQEFCETISDTDGNNPRRPQVRDLLPMNVIWYATADSDVPLSPNEILRDNVNYFAGNSNGDCPNRERVNVQIGRAPNAGATTNITACTSDTSFDIVDRLNPSILGAAMSGGTVTPAFASGTTVFNPAVDAARQYRYTITSEFGKCDDDFTFINITINQASPAMVGNIANQETCVDGNTITLATLLNANTTSLGGNFSGTGVTNGIFDPAIAGVGLFTITYNVNGDITTCTDGNASGTFTINVTAEAITAMVGTIPNQETCVDGDTITLSTLLNADTTSLNGTFTGTGVNNGIFDPATAGAGMFTITYNVNGDNNPCIDEDASGTFTINVTEEATTAMVGTIPNQETCVDGDAISLATLLNADTTSLNGTFSGTGVSNGIFDPAEAGTGTFTITYNVSGDSDTCIDGDASGTFTINVTEEATAAMVGNIPNQETCIDGDALSLGTLLDADTTSLNGTFTGTGVNNGIFDPAISGAGLFTITYNVIGENNTCIDGDASGTFTINVTDPADAPTAVASQSFCLIDNPTVGDIVVDGDNIVFYTDADLTEVADATTALGSGMDYYAVSTNDTGSCSSEATVISVTITDPSAPALTMDGDEFCRSDNPTVQDLINNFSGSGVLIYSSSTGGTAISATTALQNGVTYYGASVNATSGCESSERIAVLTKVEFCGIPEGFSPNGDGKNDQFVIPDIATVYPNYTIEIFNRWGNLVFKGNASTGDWDGISNQSGTLGNDVLPVGVYFYILKYNDGQTTPVQGKLYLSI